MLRCCFCIKLVLKCIFFNKKNKIFSVCKHEIDDTYCFPTKLVIRFEELNFHPNCIRDVHRLNYLKPECIANTGPKSVIIMYIKRVLSLIELMLSI